MESAPCEVALLIDGVIHDAEWRAAAKHKFRLSMVRIDPPATEVRTCELRVMNSANAIYVAFRVPDETVDNSISPLSLDAAILAFAQGEQVRPRDDRKLIAEGIYRDKHVAASGKGDDDDPRQDGRGAMTREKGFCVFEWAVPLDSGDDDDLRTGPGKSFRFNLAYFDALQLPLPKSRIGGIYGVQLDRSDGWGSLRLAANVANDGGTAFASPPWVRALVPFLSTASDKRLRATDASLVPASTPRTAKVLVSFTFRDTRGEEKEAKAKIFLPESIQKDSSARRRCTSTLDTSLGRGESRRISSAGGWWSRRANLGRTR